MRKRKASAVSLAGAAARRDKVRPGHEDATPERLRHARQNGAAAVDGQGIRRIAEPFDLLHTRNLLDRADVTTNEMLWHAGDRLRTHWRLGVQDGLSALDISRPVVDGGSGAGLTPTEAALRHRDGYRRAAAAIGPRLLPYVTAVVIEAQPVASLRTLVGDTAHARTAEALALERLREGLHRLCDAWDMRSSARPMPLRAWREEPGCNKGRGFPGLRPVPTG